MRRPPSRGFTLLEILTVLAIMAVLAAVAVPPLTDAIARHRLRAATTALLGSLQHGREAALWRPRGTVVCPSKNGRRCSDTTDWGAGWITKDGLTNDLLAIEDALHPQLVAFSASTRTNVTFRPPGDTLGSLSNQTLALCIRGKPATTVTVVIAVNGHSHVEPASPAIAQACSARPSRRGR